VLKPAVRVVIDWKIVTWSLSQKERVDITPSGANVSVTSRPSAPTAISRAVLRTTKRVCRLSRLRRCSWKRLVQRSLVTRQPMPPITIRAPITPLTTGLAL